jgi:hypothetical protein
LAFHSGCEADHSPPSSAKVKEWVELYLHSPNTPSWCDAQVGGTQGQFYFVHRLPTHAVLLPTSSHTSLKVVSLLITDNDFSHPFIC